MPDHSRRCPVCGRRRRTVVPPGGDGSTEVFVTHWLEDSDRPGLQNYVRCNGSRREAPLYDEDED